MTNDMSQMSAHTPNHDRFYGYSIDELRDAIINKSKEKNMAYEEEVKRSLKDTFLMNIKKEPQKSFRKAGITNGDDFLTSNGTEIFLVWLLEKHGAEFKKDVVDGILEDEEKKEKK